MALLSPENDYEVSCINYIVPTFRTQSDPASGEYMSSVISATSAE